MDFELSDRAKELREQLLAFMDEHVYPAEPVWAAQVREAGPHPVQPAIIEELKAEAKRRGLWNLFLPDEEHGAGLTNCEYAPLAEIMGRTKIASEACNCNAPDTGNIEVLHQFGTPEQKQRWLLPLLEGEIRSAFCMTEPDVASSDATNIAMRIERDGDQYVLNGRKWWTTNAAHPNLRILIVMGKTAPDGRPPPAAVDDPRPAATPRRARRARPAGVRLHETEGHGELEFTDVRVPLENILAGEGMGFMIAQARLGPGPHPPLHAGDRHGRAGARADVPARRRARGVRPARLRTTGTSATGSPRAGSRSRWRACS